MVTVDRLAQRPIPTRFRHARLYITFRCNARCGYCNVWQDPVFAGHPELGADGLRRCIDQLRSLGVSTLDITGGEPSLHRELEVAVQHAAGLGMAVEVTTNALRFAPSMDGVVPYLASLNISLDTLSAQRFHAIRGTDTLNRTVALVARVRREQPGAPVKLISVVTEQNVNDLDGVIDFAGRHRVSVYLSPMFRYFGTQRSSRDPRLTAGAARRTGVHLERTGPVDGPDLHSSSTSDAARGRVFHPFTRVNLAFLRHIETIDPAMVTVCGAGTRILTVGPAGQLLLPCYHAWDSTFGWTRPYSELIRDRRYLRVAQEEVGRRPECRRCAVYPYHGLATSYRCTREFLTQAVSEELGKIKALLDAGLPDRHRVAAPVDGLHRLLARLDRIRLSGGDGVDERYAVHAATAVGPVSELSRAPVAVEELLSDHAGEDCWRVQRTPHRFLRGLYIDVVPALVGLAAEHQQAWDLAAEALTVHQALWQALLDLLGAPGAAPATDRELAVRWCDQAARVLARAQTGTGARDATGAGEATAAAAVVNGLGALIGVEAATLHATGGLDADPERLLVAKFARTLPEARLRQLAGLLPATPSEAHRPGLAPADRADHVPADADLALAATGHAVALARLCRYADAVAREGDTASLRWLLSRWNRSVDETIGAQSARSLQDTLLARELALR